MTRSQLHRLSLFTVSTFYDGQVGSISFYTLNSAAAAAYAYCRHQRRWPRSRHTTCASGLGSRSKTVQQGYIIANMETYSATPGSSSLRLFQTPILHSCFIYQSHIVFVLFFMSFTVLSLSFLLYVWNQIVRPSVVGCILIWIISFSFWIFRFIFAFMSCHISHRDRSQVCLHEFRSSNNSNGQAICFRTTEIFNEVAKLVVNRFLGPLNENRHEKALACVSCYRDEPNGLQQVEALMHLQIHPQREAYTP